MVYKQEKLAEAEKLVALLEKKVYSVQASLKNASSLRNDLDEILELTKQLKKLSYDNEYKDIIRNQVNAKKLDEAFSRIMVELSSLKAAFSDFDKKQEDLHDVLSRLKSISEFKFSSFNEASSFIDASFLLFPAKESFISPLYLGLINLDDVATKLSLQKKGNSFVLKDASLKELLDHLYVSNIQSNFSIYNDSLKADFVSSKTVKITADPSKIKRIQIEYNEI